MKRLLFGTLAIAGLLMGSCSADDEAAQSGGSVQLDGTIGGPGGGNGSIPPPPPPPPPGG